MLHFDFVLQLKLQKISKTQPYDFSPAHCSDSDEKETENTQNCRQKVNEETRIAFPCLSVCVAFWPSDTNSNSAKKSASTQSCGYSFAFCGEKFFVATAAWEVTLQCAVGIERDITFFRNSFIPFLFHLWWRVVLWVKANKKKRDKEERKKMKNERKNSKRKTKFN